MRIAISSSERVEPSSNPLFNIADRMESKHARPVAESVFDALGMSGPKSKVVEEVGDPKERLSVYRTMSPLTLNLSSFAMQAGNQVSIGRRSKTSLRRWAGKAGAVFFRAMA